MHEIQLMNDVVKKVAWQLRNLSDARPSVVRLKVSSLSHLHEQTASTRSAFSLAARGTVVEGALLEVIRVPVGAQCRTCGARCELEDRDWACPMCGSDSLGIEDVPEVVVHEVVVEE